MSAPEQKVDFTNQFLIAMPNHIDSALAGTVIYLCDHSERGALGLVINRPTDIDLSSLFERLDVRLGNEVTGQGPVYYGGPVQTERGFVLHEATATQYNSSMPVPGGLHMTTSKDILEEVAQGKGPKKFMLALGHAGWGAGQLEQEILQNGWLTAPADTSIIFDVPAEDRFSAALGLLGVEELQLSSEVGHA